MTGEGRKLWRLSEGLSMFNHVGRVLKRPSPNEPSNSHCPPISGARRPKVKLTIHVCDECGKRRDSSANHWFAIYNQGAQDRSVTIRDLADGLHSGPYLEVCGPGCALRTLSKWMAGSLDPQLARLLEYPEPDTGRTEIPLRAMPSRRRATIGFRELNPADFPVVLNQRTPEISLTTRAFLSPPVERTEARRAKS